MKIVRFFVLCSLGQFLLGAEHNRYTVWRQHIISKPGQINLFTIAASAKYEKEALDQESDENSVSIAAQFSGQISTTCVPIFPTNSSLVNQTAGVINSDPEISAFAK